MAESRKSLENQIAENSAEKDPGILDVTQLISEGSRSTNMDIPASNFLSQQNLAALSKSLPMNYEHPSLEELNNLAKKFAQLFFNNHYGFYEEHISTFKVFRKKTFFMFQLPLNEDENAIIKKSYKSWNEKFGLEFLGKTAMELYPGNSKKEELVAKFDITLNSAMFVLIHQEIQQILKRLEQSSSTKQSSSKHLSALQNSYYILDLYPNIKDYSKGFLDILISVLTKAYLTGKSKSDDQQIIFNIPTKELSLYRSILKEKKFAELNEKLGLINIDLVGNVSLNKNMWLAQAVFQYAEYRKQLPPGPNSEQQLPKSISKRQRSVSNSDSEQQSSVPEERQKQRPKY